MISFLKKIVWWLHIVASLYSFSSVSYYKIKAIETKSSFYPWGCIKSFLPIFITIIFHLLLHIVYMKMNKVKKGVHQGTDLL